MDTTIKRFLALTIFTLLYPLTLPLIENIPNPMVPEAFIALNMIFPVLAGYFLGPASGAIAGSVGTLIAALWQDPVSIYDALAIFPHAVMGFTAGWVGAYRSDIEAALTIIIGHALNILIFLRFTEYTGYVIAADDIGPTLLGLFAETMIDVVAIVLLITLLKPRLYTTERW